MATWLIADDSMVMRTILRYMLERCGATVVAEAQEGEQAFALACELRPDAVAVDALMRGADGVAALAAIKRSLDAVKAFIVVDGERSAEEPAAMRAGADGVLRKPFQLAQVGEEIRRVMG